MINMFKKLLTYRKGAYLNLFAAFNDIVSVDELCKMLHIGKNTAYELLQNSKIKSVRIGKVYKIPKKYIIEYLENQTKTT